MRVCTQHSKRNRTTNTSGEGAPEEIQGQTASDIEQEIQQHGGGFLPALLAPLATVANPDITTHRHKPTRPRFRNDKHTRQDRHRREREGAVV